MRLIFDLDGTLVDSAGDIHAAVARLLAEEGRAALPLSLVRSFIGEGTEVLIARVIGAVAAAEGRAAPEGRQADWHGRFLAIYTAQPVALTTVMPGAREALTALRAGGWRLGICTNKPPGPTAALLGALDLAPLFETVVAGPVDGRRKPAPEPVLLAARRLGAGPAVYVGDSEIDAAAAHAAGLPFGFFTGGYARAPAEPQAFRFDSFADLPRMLAAYAPA